MKKTLCTLIALLILFGSVLPFSAQAAEPRVLSIVPALSFSGTTANCQLNVNTDYATNNIYATIKLWNGSSCVAIWGASGTGHLNFYANRTVVKGNTYTLTADVTINGVAEPQISITRTCN